MPDPDLDLDPALRPPVPPLDPPLVPPRGLAAGLRVVTRGRDRLQVGLHPGRRVVLLRTAVVERTLHDLLESGPVADDPDTAAVLDALDRAGCLVPVRVGSAPLVALVRAGAVPPGLRGEDDPGGAAALLRLAGVRVAEVRGVPGAPDPDDKDAAGVVDAALVVAWSEPDRDVLDPLLRAGVPHVLVRLVDGGAVLGPFVVPGATACLRCTDAHRAVVDPDHVAVTARYVRASRSPRSTGAAGWADRPAPHLGALAVGWAVRDLRAHLDGARPATWSSTWHLRPGGGPPVVEEWDRHPGCGCSWVADARPSGTMEP